MPAPGHLAEHHVGAAALHLFGGLHRQKVRIRPPDQAERQTLERIEERPELGRHGVRCKGRRHRLAQARVVAQVQPAALLPEQASGEHGPCVRRHARETVAVERRHRLRRLDHGPVYRWLSDIGHDRRQAFGHDLGAHVVEDHAGQAVLRHRRKHHGHEPPARRAEDRHPVKAEVVQQDQHIGGLLADLVGGGVRKTRSAAPAEIHADDRGAVRETLHHRLEILHVPGQPRQAQKRRPIARHVIGQFHAIGGGHEVHHESSNSAGTPVRSAASWAGRPGRLSTGSPARFTQSVRIP
jgi:hypothetical protein